MASGEDWHRWEVELTVNAYLNMLMLQRSGVRFVKQRIERELVGALEGRSQGAVSRKFMNISSALHEVGVPAVSGYKPLPNLQGIIREVLAEKLAVAEELVAILDSDAASQIRRGEIATVLDILEDPPEAEATRHYHRVSQPTRAQVVPARNWLEIDQFRRDLGSAGELLVLEFEDARLRAAGHHRLANQIVHVSDTLSDGLGYDILSFETSGRERLIEVKTTRYGKYTPFFASANEVNTSVEMAERFHLYRVHSFEKRPRLYQLPGSLWESCTLDPTLFRAQPGGRVASV